MDTQFQIFLTTLEHDFQTHIVQIEVYFVPATRLSDRSIASI